MRNCPKCASPMELVFQKNKEGKPSAFYICEDCGYEVEGIMYEVKEEEEECLR